MSQTPTPYDLVIADLEAKRDQINATIEMLRALGATGAIALPLPASPQRTPEPEAITKDSFFGMTVPDAARKYLNMVKVTKPNAVLCAALLAGGFKTQSSNFSEVVRSTLQRNQDFVKVSGEWGLAEWYGSRNTRRRRGSASIADSSDGSSSESEEPSEANPDGSLTN